MGSAARIIALSAGVVLFGCMYAATLFPQLTEAVMSEADAMCVPLKIECSCGLFKDSKGKCTKPGNKFMCPCFDTTSGATAASGKCMAPFKCLADQAGGMPPMLPMIPMMMPMMMMPQDPCMQPQQNNNATTSTSTPQTDPCGSGGYDSGFGGSIFDTSGYFNDTSGDISGSLFDDVGQPRGGVSNLPGSTSTGETAKAPTVPTTTSKLVGTIKIGEAGATIVANLRDGLTEVAGFFGASSLTVGVSKSIAGRLCATRPWATSWFFSKLMPDQFFDMLCSRAGYQVGVALPQGAGGGAVVAPKKTVPPPAQKQPLPNLGSVEIDIWAEPPVVRLGTRAYIFWTSKGVLECTVSGPNFTQNSLSGGASTVPLSGATIYTLECTAPGGAKTTDSVTVNLAI